MTPLAPHPGPKEQYFLAHFAVPPLSAIEQCCKSSSGCARIPSSTAGRQRMVLHGGFLMRSVGRLAPRRLPALNAAESPFCVQGGRSRRDDESMPMKSGHRKADRSSLDNLNLDELARRGPAWRVGQPNHGTKRKSVIFGAVGAYCGGANGPLKSPAFDVVVQVSGHRNSGTAGGITQPLLWGNYV